MISLFIIFVILAFGNLLLSNYSNENFILILIVMVIVILFAGRF